MYIMFTDIMVEKRINLAYPIQGKEVAIVSMFSNNVPYQIQEPFNLLLIMNEERQLPKGMFTGRELSTFVGRRGITTSLDINENIVQNRQVGTCHGGGYQLGRTRQQ